MRDKRYGTAAIRYMTDSRADRRHRLASRTHRAPPEVPSGDPIRIRGSSHALNHLASPGNRESAWVCRLVPRADAMDSRQTYVVSVGLVPSRRRREKTEEFMAAVPVSAHVHRPAWTLLRILRIDDPRLVKAMSHPLRVRTLAMLACSRAAPQLMLIHSSPARWAAGTRPGCPRAQARNAWACSVHDRRAGRPSAARARRRRAAPRPSAAG
jgi:hypothetical protein